MLNTPKWKKYWKEYLEKIDNMNDIKNSLWVEKYRPRTIDECILPTETKKSNWRYSAANSQIKRPHFQTQDQQV